MPFAKIRFLRLLMAILLPVLAVIIQWQLWEFLKPFVWILFYPAVFVSASLGGFLGGLLATVVSVALADYFFIPPVFSFDIEENRFLYSVLVFLSMGFLFGYVFEKLHKTLLEVDRLSQLELGRYSERLDQALNFADAGIWEWNLKSGEIFWSDSLWRLYGYEKASCGATYDNWLASVALDDRERVDVSLQKSLAEHSEIILEWRVFPRQDEQTRYLMSRGQPIFDDQGWLEKYRGVVVDITARKLAEESQKISESRLRLCQESGGIGTWEANFIDDTQIWSKNCYQLLGVPENTTLNWQCFLDLVHPEDRQSVIDAVGMHIHQGAKYTVDYRLNSIDGEVRWLRSSGQAERAENGELSLFRGIVQEVTEQKIMEMALKNSEAEFKLLAEAMPQIVWITRADGWNTFFNRQWFNYTGMSWEDSVGNGWNVPFHPDDRLLAWDAWQFAVSQKEIYSIEARLRKYDGSYRWWLIRGVPILNEQGVIKNWFGTCTDIDDIKQTEQSLRKAEKRWMFALEGSGQGVWEWEIQNDDLYLSPYCKTLLGFPSEESSHKLRAWMERIHPEDIESVETALLACSKETLMRFDKEYRLQMDDNDYRWIWSRGMVFDQNAQLIPTHLLGTHQDITERKTAERRLAENQMTLALLIEHAPIALAMFDNSMRYLAVSHRWIDDYNLQDQLLIGRNYYDSFPDLPLRWRQSHQRALAGEVISQAEDTFKRTDGRELIIRWELRPWRNVDNSVGGIIIFSEDITERALAQRHHRESSARLEAALASMTDAVCITDEQANIVQVNEAFVHFHKLESMTKRPTNILDYFQLFEFTDPKEQFVPLEEWPTMQALAGKEGDNVEYSLLLKQTQECWIGSFSFAPIKGPDGHIAGSVFTARDITLQKNAQQQLVLLSRALETAANGILIMNAHGVIEWVNSAFINLTGYRKPEVLGQSLSQLIDVEDRKHYESALKTMHEGGIWHGELSKVRKDGSVYEIEQTITPLRSDDGLIHHMVAIQQDITDRKRQEFELEKYRNNLEKLVEERTEALNDARERAETLAQVKSAFLANMSHEIRTPMNAVLGFCYLLEQKDLDSDTRDLASKIHNAGRTLLNLINDILDFSKIEAGRIELETIPFHLHALLDQVASVMQSMVGSKCLELVISPPLNINGLMGDEMRLQQILMNLVGNAIKFTEEGEVSLVVSVAHADAHEVCLRFSVKDSGIGLSKDQLTNLFQAFSQADSSINRRFGGTGLGLAICQRLIELMGGQLQVTSELGQGSEFWFELSFKRSFEVATTPESLSQLDLLIADDNRAAREALLRTVRSLGWKADLVDSGEAMIAQTLQRLSYEKTYDVLLIDWMMPTMDGLTAAQVLRDCLERAEQTNSRLPIVLIVTAYSKEQLMGQLGLDAIDGVLTKPVTPSSLYNAVARLKNEMPNKGVEKEIKLNKGSQLEGLRLLVVDDSDINREVAKRILESEGAMVYLADDGQYALDWLLAHETEVDLVLMDIQMPRLDGYQATQSIRQHPQFSKLPIIALTAGAFKSLQEAAMDSGMNDFIAKPFNVDLMLGKIRYWSRSLMPSLEQAAIDQAPLATDESSTAQSEVLTVLPGIDVAQGIKIWNDVKDFQSYLSRYIAQYHDMGNVIRTLIEQGDKAAVKALAHKVKGASLSMALTKIAGLCVRIENAVEKPEELMSVVDLLQEALKEVQQSLALWLATNNVPAAAEIDHNLIKERWSRIAPLIDELIQALDEDNPAHAEELIGQLDQHLAPDLLVPIRAALAEFDFREAERLVRLLYDTLAPLAG